MPTPSGRSHEGTPECPTAPMAWAESPECPQQPGPARPASRQDARAGSCFPAPHWGLRPPASAPAAGTPFRSAFLPLHGWAPPFLSPFGPSAARTELDSQAGKREDAPSGAVAPSARLLDSWCAPGAAGDARLARMVTWHSRPRLSRPGCRGEGAILAPRSVTVSAGSVGGRRIRDWLSWTRSLHLPGLRSIYY
ncbi:PREDICTED: uncharacterized protein LOC105574153 [Cercocebus atys]|uniref:uncharacterized protein LOC105574153 n=1 Tax=Cercocebus atys TaxID=9531 RepID=UPI0005F58AA1|nr:PREDICTED: uncharacterized protein LOC105574153 [Cercocebus atys]